MGRKKHTAEKIVAKLRQADLDVARALLAAGTISVADIAKRLRVNRDTLYNYLPPVRANSTAVKG